MNVLNQRVISDDLEISGSSPDLSFYNPWVDSSSIVPLPDIGGQWPLGNHRVTIPDLHEARRLLGPQSEETRHAMEHVFHEQSFHAARNRLRLGQHDRGESYVFGGGVYCPLDETGVNRHLPLHVKVVRLERWRVKSGQVLDLTVNHRDWEGLHFREELYVHIEIDCLEVEEGAILEVHGNVLVMKCKKVVRFTPEETSMNSEFINSGPQLEIRILGTRHPAYGVTRPCPAVHGKNGHDGTKGIDSSASELRPTPFGARMLVDNSKSMDGQSGQNGSDGGDATSGMAGGMSMLAVLLLGELEGFSPGGIRIFVQAGKGRPGGNGGFGGNGGNGGCGADGLNGIDGFVAGGLGGRGGDGGRGGHGGHGGHGGLASNVFVQVNHASKDCIETVSLPSIGGEPGRGGAGGFGGLGGLHGQLADVDSDDPNQLCGIEGKDGQEGRDGRPGRSRPGAMIHLITL